jgi:hypothetical protein
MTYLNALVDFIIKYPTEVSPLSTIMYVKKLNLPLVWFVDSVGLAAKRVSTLKSGIPFLTKGASSFENYKYIRR